MPRLSDHRGSGQQRSRGTASSSRRLQPVPLSPRTKAVVYDQTGGNVNGSFGQLILAKCSRYVEKRYPPARGPFRMDRGPNLWASWNQSRGNRIPQRGLYHIDRGPSLWAVWILLREASGVCRSSVDIKCRHCRPSYRGGDRTSSILTRFYSFTHRIVMMQLQQSNVISSFHVVFLHCFLSHYWEFFSSVCCFSAVPLCFFICVNWS